MSPTLIFIILAAYTLLLFVIGYFTSRKSNSESFYIGNKSSKWYLVAYGMIGASLSGVTFISVPGEVANSQFSYMIMVLGFFVGYIVIANVLMPVYYKLKLTSIYTYLEGRFGKFSYKTGASFFLLSRIIGASFRMFIVVIVLQYFVFDKWNIDFWLTVLIFISLILLYTYKGGIKTIVWTDTLQTTFMLAAVVISIILITKNISGDFSDLVTQVRHSKYFPIINTNVKSSHFWVKDFLAGIFITITMTGLDQDMMQKNLSCKNLKDAKKNMYLMSASLIPVNFVFLFLGAALYIFASQQGIVLSASGSSYTDQVFPLIALNHLGLLAGVVFIIGLISAAYSSADSALTALTTSFCIDFLNFNKSKLSEEKKKNKRLLVHISIAFVLFLLIVFYNSIEKQNIITQVYNIASYTYGPLLGLFAFGLFTKRKVKDKAVPFVAIAAPILTILLSYYSPNIFFGYQIGFEKLLINGIITFAGLLVFSRK